ncbi:hypothetical protein J7399_18090 [Shimia sp. R9_1]|uniref:hypothetical protein n=1 Tax=Shimia sp. R9_1 TaxID=2821111 RepID=UPI001ADB9584|nr:hypothetical protein [Shimia sp. R9_1]MBO9409353.1 hypothetical protein [Shimia sp. R9_1]
MPPLPLDDAINEVLNVHLSPFLPVAPGGLPNNTVQIFEAKRRGVGLGDRRGSDTRFGVTVSALRGIQLDGVARFELWDTTPDAVNTSIDAVQANVLGAAASLRSMGFLRLALGNSAPAEHVSALNAWRRTAELPFLYEYRARDSDDADSFIVRIPNRTDLEERDGTNSSLEILSGAMQRWDNERAPSLILRPNGGPRALRLSGLDAIAFLNGIPGGAVTLERGVSGATGAPVLHATLDSFLNAIADGPNPQLQAIVTLPSTAAFLAALGPAGAPFELGDWDTNLIRDLYVPHARRFDTPVTLRSGRDFLAIRHDAPAFAAPAVLYLRLQADHLRAGR